jgi:8-oxo-dGTP pyrophosphatase MutT (NUDIX family)
VTLSALEFFSRAQERLTFDVPAGFADPNVIPRHDQQDADPAVVAAIAAVRPIRPAAVLVPIIERDEPTVLFTQRTAHLADHAGQISFPGGKIDAGDESPAAAALREAEEEIAIARRFVEPLGYLDIHMTPFGHRIVPVLARVKPGFALRFNKGEVDDAFEVPLASLCRRKTTSARAETGRGSPSLSTPCRSAAETSGARPRLYFGTCTNGCIEDDNTNVCF